MAKVSNASHVAAIPPAHSATHRRNAARAQRRLANIDRPALNAVTQRNTRAARSSSGPVTRLSSADYTVLVQPQSRKAPPLHRRAGKESLLAQDSVIGHAGYSFSASEEDALGPSCSYCQTECVIAQHARAACLEPPVSKDHLPQIAACAGPAASARPAKSNPPPLSTRPQATRIHFSTSKDAEPGTYSLGATRLRCIILYFVFIGTCPFIIMFCCFLSPFLNHGRRLCSRSRSWFRS